MLIIGFAIKETVVIAMPVSRNVFAPPANSRPVASWETRYRQNVSITKCLNILFTNTLSGFFFKKESRAKKII